MLCDRGRICAVMWVFPESIKTSYGPANTQAECIEVAQAAQAAVPGGHGYCNSMQSVPYHLKVSVEWTVLTAQI
jgi:hypothetical protein